MSVPTSLPSAAARTGTDPVRLAELAGLVEPLHRLDERDLVERAKRDPQAFGELYLRLCGHVYRFARSRMRDPHDAEDLTSEVFCRALAGIGRYQDTGAPILNWLLRIATNAIIDQQRQRRRRPQEDLYQHESDLVADGSVEDLVARRDLLRRIALAARQLPGGQPTVLALRFERALTHAQIGRLTGRSELASKICLHRAIVGVRAALGAAEGRRERAS